MTVVVMNEMELNRDDCCEGTETAAADTTSDSSQLESPALCTPSDHCRWVHHSSGRVLPVGIAHPLKVDHTIRVMANAGDDSEAEEYEDVLKGSSHKDTTLLKHHSNPGSSSKEDQSSDDNEEQNPSSSADTSDSSSSSSDEDDGQEIISPPEITHHETYKKENKEKDLMEPSHVKSRTITSPFKGGPPSQSHSYSRSTMLPAGKEWHLFVSHSTADKDLVRENVLLPMREKYHFKVKACYHCMPDPGRYDDKVIHKDMKESCAIMIGLSPPYLASTRCVNEWNLAVKLQQSGVCNVIVSAFGVVSRPAPLKNFVYLDFMDKSKRENVMVKLQIEIGNYVKPRLPPSREFRSPSPSYGSHGCQEKEEVPTPLKPDPLGLESSLPFKGPLSSRSTTKLKPVPFNEQEHNEDDYDDQDCKRLEEEFEAEYDYPSQEEEQTYGRIEQQPAETTDSGNEISSNSDSEGENDYHSTVHQEESSHRGKKRHTSIPQEEESLLRTKKMRTSIPQQEESSPRGKKRHTSIPQEEESLLRTKKMRTSIPQQEESSPRGKKRCHEEREEEEGEVSDDGDGSQSQQPGNAAQVASFYNTLAEPNLESRNKSPIFHMRNFNNWVKSVLIRIHLDKVGSKAYVLDLCCGKGGDLLKWKEGGISYLVGADIAATSIEQCRSRYDSDKMKNRRGGHYFEADFHVADCTQVRLRDVYRSPGCRFDITSCQFSLHYCFESVTQAEMMLRNLCENLRPGGYFIGTTVDSNELVRRFRESTEDNHMCGNKLYSAVPSFDLDDIPLFGAKYDFHLEGVVDVPEYLIHFPLLARMLEVYNMKPVLKESFHNFFFMRRNCPEDIDLLYRMQALSRENGEISEEEWEAIGLYLVFAFQKCVP